MHAEIPPQAPMVFKAAALRQTKGITSCTFVVSFSIFLLSLGAHLGAALSRDVSMLVRGW